MRHSLSRTACFPSSSAKAMAPFRDMAPAIETLSDEYAAKDEGADQFYHVPSLVLESGLALPSVRLAYQT